ncbi:MAG: WecB/TagA/CpsF family glycosyltransferase [Fulvimarina manganoxydans]|uniref:WecB/TagA/CpsF family glycosyltransferase n=1 Tax=Fulvimarina manganoxydans TaxID=937218 RepID=UPI0023544215|nr:WecB/TagA/CpsF family glycosyltransferase [Fulvimarina manganoxydans]MCK5931950.1 WecB/TagA/CpsF family glycosyltransferase [Fulvimarina manganoxydans]
MVTLANDPVARTIDFLGLRFIDADLAGIRKTLTEALEGGGYRYVVTPNVDHVVSYHHGGDRALVRAYDAAALQICDSRILALLGRAAGVTLHPCPGSDLTESLLSAPLRPDIRIGVVGPERAAFEALRKRYPEVALTFIASEMRLTVGSPEWQDTVERANLAEWDILLVCLSFPKQEFFARDLAPKRTHGVALCVGASVDFLTGRQKRAPKGFQRLGLEWLYRLSSDPKRMARRYLVKGPKIVPLVARDVLAGRRGRAATGAPSSAILPFARPRRAGASGAVSKTARPPRVLFLSTVLPHEERGGGEICSMNVIEALRRAGCDVEVLAYRRSGSHAPLPEGFTSAGERAIESAEARLQSAVWMGRAALSGEAYSSEKYVSDEMRSEAVGRLAEGNIDLVILDHAQSAWLLPIIPGDLPVVFVAHNAEHQLYADYARAALEDGTASLKAQAKAAIYRREALRLKRLEQAVLDRASAVWALTKADAEALRQLDPEALIEVVPVPGKTPALALDGGSVKRPSIDIGLLGNFAWDVNRAGLDWFLDEVVPHLDPRLSIRVGGKTHFAPGTVRAPVTFAGFVPDAEAFLRDCRVVAIPSVVGSGIQIKTIETLALGRPTVATPIALRGIETVPDGVRVAETAEAMARELTAALQKLGIEQEETASNGILWWRERRQAFDEIVQARVRSLLGEPREPVRATACIDGDEAA